MFLAGGAGDWTKLSNINDPLPQAMKMIVGEHSGWLHMLVWIGLFGLIASFHGIILGYSRQIFALARSGYLPGFLAAVHPRFGTPWVGVLAGGVVGILAIFSDQLIVIGGQPLTANIVTMSVLGAIVMYIMSMASLFVLRRKEPGLARPFPAIGYPVLPAIALVLAVGCLITMVWFNTLLSAIFLGAMAVAWVYFHFFTAQRRAAVAELTVVSVEVVQAQG
jgi:ethanolamine permease